MAMEWGKNVQGHIESYVRLQETILPEAEWCLLLKYNDIHDTMISLEHRHTSDSHISSFTDSWDFRSVRDSRNHLALFSHFSSLETKGQEQLRVEHRAESISSDF